MRRPVTFSVTGAALIAGSILVTLVQAASGAGPGSPPAQADALRRTNAELTSRSHSVVLELYGLDSELAGARQRLASLQARVDEVRHERATVGEGVRIARHASLVSQRALGSRLRVLYEEGDADPLAILLGSASLDEAITRLDDLRSIAEQDQAVIAQTHKTGGKLKKLARTLSLRQAELNELESDAAAAVSRLEATQAARARYLDRLATERRLNAGHISTLEAEAQAAQSKAAAVTAATAPSAAVTFVTPVATTAQPGGALTVLATGYALSGTTATGVPVGPGVVAVDPSVIPLGTRMSIPGYGEGVAADVGSGVRGAMIDLWFPTTAQALAWGRRSVTVTLH